MGFLRSSVTFLQTFISKGSIAHNRAITNLKNFSMKTRYRSELIDMSAVPVVLVIAINKGCIGQYGLCWMTVSHQKSP